ncbi:hypothetical protein AAMO2058_000517200 [Amorphochlora amoebiformis]
MKLFRRTPRTSISDSDASHALKDDPKVKQALKGETMLWVGCVEQLAGVRSKELKERVLIISDAAVYKVRLENLSKPKRRIDLKDVRKISYNTRTDEFFLHCTKFNIHYKSRECKDIVVCIDKAKAAYEKRNGIFRSNIFLVDCSVSNPQMSRHSFRPPSSKSISTKSKSVENPMPIALLQNIKSLVSQKYKHYEINNDLVNSLQEQTANFRMCFCLAGYRMCKHVHPTFTAARASTEGGESSSKAVDANLKMPTTSGNPSRRRKAGGKNMEAAAKLREKNANERKEAAAADEEKNIVALDKLNRIMEDVRRKGIQVRRAQNDMKKNYTYLNPAVEQFLRSAKDPKLIQLTGLKLLESVYNLSSCHLEFLAGPIDGIEHLVKAKAKAAFRKIARQCEDRKYDLLLRIGKGAFGEVFIGKPLPRKYKKVKSGDRIAVKTVDMAGEGDLAEINKEIEALAEGEICPQLVHYYGCETLDRYLMLSMELMDGSLDKLKPLKEAAVAVIMREALLGLSFLWNKYKKFHRDLKAANILYSLKGEIKLADFGCVRSLGNTMKANTYVGSPYWMAPEIMRGRGYNQMVDVWSLGITAMELVMGKVPNYNKAPKFAMAQSIRSPEPRLPERGYSADVKNFVVACLQKDPSRRFPVDKLLTMPFIKKAGDLKSWLPGKAFHLKAIRKEWEKKKLAK